LNDEPNLSDLTRAALDFARMIEAEHLEGNFVGAFAAGFVSEPRATRDIDAMIFWEERSPQLLCDLAECYGFVLRSENSMEIARRSRVLLLKHKSSGITVDVSLGILPFEREMAQRALRFEREGVQLPTATAEDLFVMKVLAGREKDLFDLRQIRAMNRDLDESHIMKHVREMAEVLENPEMVAVAERILRDR
jgi:hypothetical protein